MQMQIIISLITILGAGVSVYVGVRVALAEIRRDIRSLESADAALQRAIERDVSEMRARIERLESGYFSRAKHE